MDAQIINTSAVCERLGLSEPALRHLLRRPGAPRPALHPSARVFLWTDSDVEALRCFIAAAAKTQGQALRCRRAGCSPTVEEVRNAS